MYFKKYLTKFDNGDGFSLNFKGEGEVRSPCFGLVNLLVWVMMLIYKTEKFNTFARRQEITVS
jgi:hypothetical protein